MSLGSVTAKNIVLAACYGDSHSSAWPATVYLALFSGDPAAGGTELTDGTGGYARVAINNDSTQFADPSGGSQANAADFVFAASNDAFSGPFDHWAYMDLSTAGHVLDCGPISGGAQSVNSAGVQLTFPAGALVVSA